MYPSQEFGINKQINAEEVQFAFEKKKKKETRSICFEEFLSHPKMRGMERTAALGMEPDFIRGG